MARVVWTFAALDDLEEAVTYIERNAPIAASRFLEKVLARARALERSPHLGGFMEEDKSHTFRQLLYGNYRIIYRYAGDTVRIVAFMHAARLLDVEDIQDR
jgi:plasmid stabilization system protein ParE